jgi:S1-C subfamily serine protease
MTTHFVWTCPQCARTVPNRVDGCRCGYVRPAAHAAAASDAPVAAATSGGVDSRRSQPRGAWNRAALVAAAAGLAIALTGIGVFWLMPSPAAPAQVSAAASTGAVSASTPPSRLPAVSAVPTEDKPSLPLSDGAFTGSADLVSLLSIEQLVARIMPAVVTIRTDDGQGSAFFVSKDTLVTNAHVVGSARVVRLHRPTARQRTAWVERQFVELDLAILKVDAADRDQIALALAQPADIRVGSEVIAIGSPLGLQNSVTRGIVSAVRDIGGVTLIQTDAAINPGNSGGPLLDRYGRVVGMNTLKIGGRVESIGFAVSVHHVRGSLGPTFQPKSDADGRRELALQEYDRAVQLLATRADAVERNWKSFRESCYIEDAAPGAPREWFALAGNPRLPLRESPSCGSWLPYFKESAVKMHQAIKQADAKARASGVSTERMQVVRRRYTMVWSEWDE